MRITILSTSFRRPSVTFATATDLAERFRVDHEVTVLDAYALGALPLVGLDVESVDAEEAARFQNILSEADAVVIGVPLYRCSVSGAAKGLIDVFGDAFQGKPVGVFVAAGGAGAFYAVADLDRSLNLDLGCPVCPQRVLVAGEDVSGMDRRLEDFAEVFAGFARRHADEFLPTI